MKKLEDLKRDILANKIENFYVFYGEDYGIRKHYIEQIKKSFNGKAKYMEACDKIQVNSKTTSLFDNGKQLYLVYNDVEFANSKSNIIDDFISKLTDDTVILIYEEALESSSLFKDFDQYITYFPEVQDNIGKEFVNSEVKLTDSDVENLAFNCRNNYNTILLETDKIKEYAEGNNTSQVNSYEALSLKNQMIERIDKFDANAFMIDVLCGNRKNIAYWYQVALNDSDKFFGSMAFIFNDYLIAFYLVKYGKWTGGSRAYESGLSWGRVKVLRDLIIPFEQDALLFSAYKVACVDVNVKSGKLERGNVVDYFFSSILEI